MAAKVNLGIWNWLSNFVIFLMVLLGLLGVIFWYLPLIKQDERMRKKILSLEAQIRQTDEDSRRLEIAIRALRDDPKTLERLAREKLGYARPGETVIYFDKPQGVITNAVVFPR
jgi:cell division protein FtsB